MSTAQESYTRWLAAEIQAAIDDPRPSIPHEEVMAEMEAEIARLKEGNPTKHIEFYQDGRDALFKSLLD